MLKNKKNPFLHFYLSEFYDLLFVFTNSELFIYSAFNKKMIFYLELEEFKENNKIKIIIIILKEKIKTDFYLLLKKIENNFLS